jgi:rhamnogalacturonan acetylesterase
MSYRVLTTLLSLASIAFAIPTLYLVGDSTMANLHRDDLQGYVVAMPPCVNHKPFPCRWGQFIDNYVDGLNIVNKAIAGRSARSYTREGRWSEVQGLLNAGDYVIIEFGLCHQLRGRAERLTVLSRAQ